MGQAATAADFRNANWADTVAQVKKSETGKFLESTENQHGIIILKYAAQLLGNDVAVEFYFDANCKMLSAAHYVFGARLNVSESRNVSDALEQKYGERIEKGLDMWKTDRTFIDFGNSDGIQFVRYTEAFEMPEHSCPEHSEKMKRLRDNL
jgi:hypothetical protein